MYYFMSEPHGDDKAYFDMKEKINFSPSDELYILGDVLGGDPKHPERCLRILDDIMKNPNIFLVLGDFEYNYLMSELVNSDEKINGYKQHLRQCYGAEAFVAYMNSLPAKEKMKYLIFLHECNVAEKVFIGERLFYLVHGAPAICFSENQGYMARWQRNVVETELDLKADYRIAVLSDRSIKGKIDVDYDKVIIVAGHQSTAFFEHNKSIFHNHAQMIYKNNRFLIHCGIYENGECKDNTLCCLAIDESGERIGIHYRHE